MEAVNELRWEIKGIHFGIRDVVMGVLILMFALLIARGNFAQDKAFHRADKSACMRIEKLKALARTQLIRSRTTLPTLYYYQQNPDELASQLATINRQIRDFRPVKC